MKLIIDIPDNWEEELNQSKITFADVVDIDTIRNGIPLDKLRAEVEQITDTMGVSYNQYVSKIDVLQIIDKYGGDRE